MRLDQEHYLSQMLNPFGFGHHSLSRLLYSDDYMTGFYLRKSARELMQPKNRYEFAKHLNDLCYIKQNQR